MANRTKITLAGAHAFAAADGRETWIVHRHCNGSVIKRTLGALTVEDARHGSC